MICGSKYYLLNSGFRFAWIEYANVSRLCMSVAPQINICALLSMHHSVAMKHHQINKEKKIGEKNNAHTRYKSIALPRHGDVRMKSCWHILIDFVYLVCFVLFFTFHSIALQMDVSRERNWSSFLRFELLQLICIAQLICLANCTTVISYRTNNFFFIISNGFIHTFTCFNLREIEKGRDRGRDLDTAIK